MGSACRGGTSFSKKLLVLREEQGFLRSIIAHSDSSLIDGVVLMCPALIRSSRTLGVSTRNTTFGVCFHNFFIHRDNGVLWWSAEKHQRNSVLDDCSGMYMCSEELSMRVELLCAILDPGVGRVCIEYESRVASQAACSTHYVRSRRSVTRISACLVLLFADFLYFLDLSRATQDHSSSCNSKNRYILQNDVLLFSDSRFCMRRVM